MVVCHVGLGNLAREFPDSQMPQGNKRASATVAVGDTTAQQTVQQSAVFINDAERDPATSHHYAECLQGSSLITTKRIMNSIRKFCEAFETGGSSGVNTVTSLDFSDGCSTATGVLLAATLSDLFPKNVFMINAVAAPVGISSHHYQYNFCLAMSKFSTLGHVVALHSSAQIPAASPKVRTTISHQLGSRVYDGSSVHGAVKVLTHPDTDLKRFVSAMTPFKQASVLSCDTFAAGKGSSYGLVCEALRHLEPSGVAPSVSQETTNFLLAGHLSLLYRGLPGGVSLTGLQKDCQTVRVDPNYKQLFRPWLPKSITASVLLEMPSASGERASQSVNEGTGVFFGNSTRAASVLTDHADRLDVMVSAKSFLDGYLSHGICTDSICEAIETVRSVAGMYDELKARSASLTGDGTPEAPGGRLPPSEEQRKLLAMLDKYAPRN